MPSEKTLAWFYVALVALITAAAIAVACIGGCAGKTVSGLAPAATADGRSSASADGAGSTAVSKQQTNDPIVGWILAGGAAIVTPVCFLLYMLSKRTWVHRWLTGACTHSAQRPAHECTRGVRTVGAVGAEIARLAVAAGREKPP